MSAVKPAAIAGAVLLPPLGVFLDQGLTPNFWIASALTPFFFLPGVAFALFTVLRRKAALASA